MRSLWLSCVLVACGGSDARGLGGPVHVAAGVDPLELMKQAIDNCPDCQAARARGEQPLIGSFDRAHVDQPQIVSVEPESRQLRRARQRKLARWMRGR
jgi:hypothetical protein